MKLSIVIPTLNRVALLQACVASIERNTRCDHEIIVVDGGSTDGTLEWLHKQETRLRFSYIEQGRRVGCIAAVNVGCAHVIGDYVAILNDDSVILDPCLDSACKLMERDQAVGQVAIPFVGPHLSPKIDRTFPLAGRRWVYANFGVTRRPLGDRLGWWGDTHYQYGGDAELSLKIWNAGYRVVPLERHCIHHLEVHDETRIPNTDSDDFYRKWRQWEGPGDDNPLFAR